MLIIAKLGRSPKWVPCFGDLPSVRSLNEEAAGETLFAEQFAHELDGRIFRSEAAAQWRNATTAA
jgi:hypothetical protein